MLLLHTIIVASSQRSAPARTLGAYVRACETRYDMSLLLYDVARTCVDAITLLVLSIPHY